MMKSRNFGILLLAMVTGPAFAEGYFTPAVRGGVEYNTNRGMDTVSADEEDTTSYIVELEATLGYRTPRSDTRFVPMIRFREVSGATDIDPDGTDEYLNYRTRFVGERTQFDITGRYRREDVYEGELPPAGFDDFDPDDPTAGAGGRVTQDTRERIQLRPRYMFQMTPRIGIGMRAVAESVEYEKKTTDEEGYDYWSVDGFVTWRLTERWMMGIGPTVSSQETADHRQTDAYGIAVDFRYQWTQQSGVQIDTAVQRNTLDDDTTVAGGKEEVTRWRANVEAFHKGSEVSEWRMAAGRFLRPSTRGGKVTSDEVRFQYDRQLSQRLGALVAMRVMRDESVSAQQNQDEETYGRVELDLQYALTPRWSVVAGYEYTHQKFQADDTRADDHQLMIGISFRGLGPPPL